MNPTVYAARSIPAYRSDLYNIPYGNVVFSGINDGTAFTYDLQFQAVNILDFNLKAGDTVLGTPSNAISTIAFDPIYSNQITITDPVFNSGDVISVYQGQNQGCLLYVANSDNPRNIVDIKVLTASNNIVLFPDFPVGNLLPVKVLRVFETDTYTGVLDLIAIW